MNTPIPVGLIGLGRHGNRYLKHLVQEKTGGKLVGISRQHADKGSLQAVEHGIQFFSDYRDLIASPAIEAVLVVTPTALHAQIALEAIRHRKPVLIEKPLTLNSTKGTHVVETAYQAGVPLMTGHTLRYEPVIQKIQEIAAAFGLWQSFNGTMHLEKRPDDRKAGAQSWHPLRIWHPLARLGAHDDAEHTSHRVGQHDSIVSQSTREPG